MGIAEFQSAISAFTHLSADTSVFLYHFENHLKYSDLTQLLLDSLDSGQFRATVSVVVIAEILAGPYRTGDVGIAGEYLRAFRLIRNLTVAEVSQPIAIRAARLRGELGLRLPDAIVAATALEAGAGALVTNDRVFRRLSDLPVVLLDDYS